MEEEAISLDEITILLNILANYGENFEIYSPLLKIGLITFNYYDLTKFHVIDKPSYTNIINEFLNKIRPPIMKQTIEMLKGELPDYSKLRDALQISGVLEFINTNQILEKLDEEIKSRPSIEKPKPLFLALDTGVLYNRFATNYLTKLSTKPNIVISPVVLGEINRLIDSKINPTIISLMRHLFKHIANIDEIIYSTIPSFKARKALLALAERVRIEKSLGPVYIPPQEYYGHGDQAIIDSYLDFSKSRNCDIILLTFDDKMRGKATNLGLGSLLILQPSTLEIKEYLKPTYETLKHLIYILAIYYIIITIRCGIYQFTIKGVWKGKKIEDWINERVKISSSEELLTKLRKTVHKVRKLKEIL